MVPFSTIINNKNQFLTLAHKGNRRGLRTPVMYLNTKHLLTITNPYNINTVTIYRYDLSINCLYTNFTGAHYIVTSNPCSRTPVINGRDIIRNYHVVTFADDLRS